jgi:hypothetical protein
VQQKNQWHGKQYATNDINTYNIDVRCAYDTMAYKSVRALVIKWYIRPSKSTRPDYSQQSINILTIKSQEENYHRSRSRPSKYFMNTRTNQKRNQWTAGASSSMTSHWWCPTFKVYLLSSTDCSGSKRLCHCPFISRIVSSSASWLKMPKIQ